MTQRPLARIGFLAGAVLAASVGISGIAQAHTAAQVDPSTETMASHMDMTTSAMLAEMAPLGPLTAGPHGPGQYGTVGGEHLGMQHKGKKCCAHCKGKEKARRHKQHGSCCSASRTSHHASAHEGRTMGCCNNAKKAKSA